MSIGTMQRDYILRRTEILIVIANQDEMKGFKAKLQNLGINTFVEFEINSIDIKSFKCNEYHISFFLAPNIGPNAMSNALREVGDNFTHLKYIVNLGCCGTTNKKVSNKVIYADRIFDADLRKEEKSGTKYAIGENKHLSGKRFPFDLGENVNNDYEVDLAPLIASSAVVKERKSKNKYTKTFPYAAGIEMEGVAVSQYAISKNIEWIVIKGTSDNCIKKKGSEGQQKATQNATDLLFQLLKTGQLSRERLNVFVSGAVEKPEQGVIDNYDEIEDNVCNLGIKLLENNCKIINGLGYCVGTSLVLATYSYKRDADCGTFSDFMEIFPFTRTNNQERKMAVKNFYNMNRNNMISSCLISIFIYGRNTELSDYNGMLEEFNIAGNNKPRIVIPIPGFYSEKLYNLIGKTNYDGIKCKDFLRCYKQLNSDISTSNKIELTIGLIKILDDYYYSSIEK